MKSVRSAIRILHVHFEAFNRGRGRGGRSEKGTSTEKSGYLAPKHYNFLQPSWSIFMKHSYLQKNIQNTLSM